MQRRFTKKKAVSHGAPGAKWFSAPLDTQPVRMDRGHRVPVILAELRNALEDQGGLAAEGIFRISAEVSKQHFVRERLESGEEPEDVFGGCDVELLAGLLKEWLRELPDGLWASVSLDARHEFEAQLAGSSQSSKHVAMILKQAMPPLQREVFLWVLDMLADATHFESSSKMGLEGLSAIFAPVLVGRRGCADVIGKHGKREEASMQEQLDDAKTAVILCRNLLEGHVQTRPAPVSQSDRPTPLAGGPPGGLRLTRGGSKRAASRPDDYEMRKKASSTGLTEYAKQVTLFEEEDGK